MLQQQREGDGGEALVLLDADAADGGEGGAAAGRLGVAAHAHVHAGYHGDYDELVRLAQVGGDGGSQLALEGGGVGRRLGVRLQAEDWHGGFLFKEKSA